MKWPWVEVFRGEVSLELESQMITVERGYKELQNKSKGTSSKDLSGKQQCNNAEFLVGEMAENRNRMLNTEFQTKVLLCTLLLKSFLNVFIQVHGVPFTDVPFCIFYLVDGELY